MMGKVRKLCAIAILLVACGTQPVRPTPTAKLADLDDSYTDADARREASLKACPSITRPRLFRIEKAGKTSHLFGTYHIGVGRDRLPAVVQRAFTNARIVAFESLNDDETRTGDDQLDRSLSTELGPDAWSRLVALVGADAAEKLETEPAMTAILILSVMYIDTSAMLDEELEQAARESDKQLVALETSASLQGVFRRWFNARTLRTVLLASKGRKEMRERSLASLADYCAGRDRDTDLGDGMSASERKQINHDLLDARNAAWMEPLDKIFANGDAFVAVGAAHLRGKNSVIDLLQQRGYRVTRVE
jgi:uncharacterized protein YbaP (TraB family)